MTQVTLFNQGLVQVLQAAVTGLEPKQPYVLALATQADGGRKLEAIASFVTNPAGAAIVSTVGPIRQVVEVSTPESRRYLVIAPGCGEHLGHAVQVQMP
jgi:hypothetical protein